MDEEKLFEDVDGAEKREEEPIISGSLSPEEVPMPVSGSLPPEGIRYYHTPDTIHRVKLEIPTWFATIIIIDSILLIYDVILLIMK